MATLGKRGRKSLLLIGSTVSMLLPTSCASPGLPRAPSLNLPETVTSLTAERVGDEVRLRWTTPDKTTDGLEVRGAMMAEICRRPVSASRVPVSDCLTIHRGSVKPGPSEIVDRLSPAWTRATGTVLEYQVRIRNHQERATDAPAVTWTLAGPAPAPPRDLQVEATEQGALILWKSDGTAEVVELLREHPASPLNNERGPVSIGRKVEEPREVRLRVPPEMAANGSSGASHGALDQTATIEGTYVYTAQRVWSETLMGHSLEIRSEASSPQTIVMRDTFAPRPPSGLQAVASANGIDLSWHPNRERDLAGYEVFRQGVDQAVAVRLNAGPLPEPGFRDATCMPGYRFKYWVVAIDTSGNRSQPSPTVEEEVHDR